jgi:hypothetical protein
MQRWAEVAAPIVLSIRLELMYLERILVPRGSQLIVRVENAAGQIVFDETTATERDGPPYIVAVEIRRAVTFPLRIAATLVSRLGPRFSESTTLAQAEAGQTHDVKITLRKL